MILYDIILHYLALYLITFYNAIYYNVVLFHYIVFLFPPPSAVQVLRLPVLVVARRPSGLPTATPSSQMVTLASLDW